MKRVRAADGSEEVTYDCGHTATFVVPTNQEVNLCSDCAAQYVEKHP